MPFRLPFKKELFIQCQRVPLTPGLGEVSAFVSASVFAPRSCPSQDTISQGQSKAMVKRLGTEYPKQDSFKTRISASGSHWAERPVRSPSQFYPLTACLMPFSPFSFQSLNPQKTFCIPTQARSLPLRESRSRSR